VAQLVNRTSVRSKILIGVTFLFFMNGLNILTNPTIKEYAHLDPSLTAHLKVLSVTNIGWLFVMFFPFVVLLIFCRKVVAAYALTQFLTATWGLLFIVSWIDTGYWRGLYSAVTYLVLTAFLYVGSQIIDHREVKKLAKEIEPSVGGVE
jgi:hypothetical protein